MNIEIAEQILAIIEQSKLVDLRDEFFDAMIRYANIRANWYQFTYEQRMNADAGRTRAHNTVIDYCNIMSRNMIKHGEDGSWRRLLTDDRKIIGDFACYITCIIGIRSR